EAQLVHVVRGAGGSTKWVRRIRVTLAAVNGPAFLPEKKEARPSEFAQGGSDLAARLTERDRRQIGRDGGSLHQVRPKTEELHEEDRGELANADLQLVGMTGHRRRHDRYTLLGIGDIETIT